MIFALTVAASGTMTPSLWRAIWKEGLDLLAKKEAAQAAEDWAALDAAKAAFKDFCAFVAPLIVSTPWGRNGCVFVTQRSFFPRWGGERTVHINGRKLVSVDNDGYVKFFSPEEGEKNFQELQALRPERRLAQEEYLLLREEVAELLLSSGPIPENEWGVAPIIPGWQHWDGQQGGCYCQVGGSSSVSYGGALRRARKLAAEQVALTPSSHEEEVERRYHGAKWQEVDCLPAASGQRRSVHSISGISNRCLL